MSFVAVAVGVVGEGVAANLLAGAMMGATTTVAGNVIGGRDPFDNIGRGIVMGGLTGGLTPGVAEAFQVGMPAAAGITSFGLNTLATGDLGKGLMAGATAYGLYGLSENMTAAGGNVLIGDATGANSGILMSDLMAEQGIYPTLESGAVNPEYISEINKTTANAISQGRNAALPEKLSRGFDAAKAAPGTFFKDNAKNLMYAAGPILADAEIRSNMPTTTTRPGAMRRFSYDPYGQIYTPIGNYEVPVKAAGGGLMGMNDGGYSPGQLNFAERSEPVVRMARGGIAHFEGGGNTAANSEGGLSADDARSLIEAQYATIGRSGVGEGANQIDQAGLNAWTDALVRGDFNAADLSSRFGTAVTDYMTQNPDDKYTSYVKNYQAGTGGNAATTGNVATTGGLDTLAAANNIANVTTGTTGGTNLAAFSNDYTGANINDYIANNQLDAAGITAAGLKFNVDPAQITAAQNAQNIVTNVYRNVLGRDPDPAGLSWWTNQIMNGDRTGAEMYESFRESAKSLLGTGGTKELFKDLSLADATKDYGGYQSADKRTIADEWVRNTLGREVTEDDRKQQWYKDASDSSKMKTVGIAEDIYSKFKNFAYDNASTTVTQQIKDAKATLSKNGLTEADVLRQTGKTIAELVGSGMKLENDLFKASQLLKPGQKAGFDFNTITKPKTGTKIDTVVGGGGTDVIADGFYGNDTGNALTRTPGDITTNKDGTKTITPNIPGRPDGGFPGVGAVKDAYVEGGGSLGYIPYAPKTIEEFESKYNTLTGGSKEAYDRLTGKTKYSATPFTETGEVMKPYVESVLGRPLPTSTKRVLFDPVTKTYKNNPDYVPVSYTDKGKKVYGLSGKDIAAQLPAMDPAKSDYEKWMNDNNVTYAQIAEALGISLAEAKKRYPTKAAATTTASETPSKEGGLMKLAGGGMAQQFDLGGYSDGGRLLRGPGDGVSDSIPATIGNKRPARLADGEFVVPARIVSELGNGSTEAGARKLYAMMDRVQSARRGSIGKGKVAKNSRADKYLPA